MSRADQGERDMLLIRCKTPGCVQVLGHFTDAGRKLFDLTASERKQRAREQRYRLHLIDMELAGVITTAERRRTLADLNRAARRRSGS